MHFYFLISFTEKSQNGKDRHSHNRSIASPHFLALLFIVPRRGKHQAQKEGTANNPSLTCFGMF
jgi:hypothetical protein